ncbi:MAG: DoxX family protein [Myxococcales bacterium]
MSLSLSSNPASTSFAASAPSSATPRKEWVSRILTGLALLMLGMDTALKLFQLAPALEANRELGFPPSALGFIGWAELACLVAYLIPRTAPLGAILWTGFLGGAVATHVRLDSPLFSHTLFPMYMAVLLWLPLWLRDARVRRLFDAEAR